MSGENVQARRPWAESVATFFTCLALGPPIGGIVFALCVAFIPAMGSLASTGAQWDVQGGLIAALFVGLFAIPFSYLVGGFQAAVTGLLFAGWGWARGRPPLGVALAITAVVFIGVWLAGMADDGFFLPAMVLVHAVPTLICWLIIRTYWRDTTA